jgi:hypothetical protein
LAIKVPVLGANPHRADFNSWFEFAEISTHSFSRYSLPETAVIFHTLFAGTVAKALSNNRAWLNCKLPWAFPRLNKAIKNNKKTPSFIATKLN